MNDDDVRIGKKRRKKVVEGEREGGRKSGMGRRKKEWERKKKLKV